MAKGVKVEIMNVLDEEKGDHGKILVTQMMTPSLPALQPKKTNLFLTVLRKY